MDAPHDIALANSPPAIQNQTLNEQFQKLMLAIRNLSKSKTDRVIGGVCGGLGAHTPIPTWIWRAGFLVFGLFFGGGVIVYVILWIALPDEKPMPPPRGGPDAKTQDSDS